MADPEDTTEEVAESAVAAETPKRRTRAKKAVKGAKAPKAPKAPRASKRAKAVKAAEATPKPREAEAPALKAGHVHVYSLAGDVVKSIELPPVFQSDVRFDLIRRAVTAFQANRRQPYAPAARAGMRHSVRWSGKGHGVSRVPRIRGTMIGAQAPGTVGGRRAHPPRIESIWAKKINAHERHLARNAALAALNDSTLVVSRGHRFKKNLSVPVIVEDGIESVETDGGAVREGIRILNHLGLLDDVDRAREGRHIRAGRGKMRGRRYRQPRSLLIVVKEPAKVRRLFGNLPGVDVVTPASLNAEVLAPGGDPGRLTVFSEAALEILRSWVP